MPVIELPLTDTNFERLVEQALREGITPSPGDHLFRVTHNGIDISTGGEGKIETVTVLANMSVVFVLVDQTILTVPVDARISWSAVVA